MGGVLAGKSEVLSFKSLSSIGDLLWAHFVVSPQQAACSSLKETWSWVQSGEAVRRLWRPGNEVPSDYLRMRGFLTTKELINAFRWIYEEEVVQRIMGEKVGEEFLPVVHKIPDPQGEGGLETLRCLKGAIDETKLPLLMVRMNRCSSDKSQQTQIISWNVNGLGQQQKWRKVHNLFKNTVDFDIVCRQETKLDEDKLNQLRVPLIDGELKWVPAMDSKGGLSMAVHPSLVDSILDYREDEEGWPQTINGVVGPVQKWFQWMVIQKPMGPMSVCNVYAPQTIIGGNGCFGKGFRKLLILVLRGLCVVILTSLNLRMIDQVLWRQINYMSLWNGRT